MLKVIISNGHFKFILGPAAAEANKRNILDCFITAGYPTKKVKQWISFFGLERYGVIKRLLKREELIPESLVHPLWLSELIIQVGVVVRKVTRTTKYSEWLDDYGLRLYGHQASRIVRRSTAQIYHYRSGYGHNSVKVAKQQGMTVLCDHSIAHPALVEYLIHNQGTLPAKNSFIPINAFWSNILEDVNQADAVLVNSDFVRETFIHQGWAPARVHVVYTGVDTDFLNAISIPVRSHAYLNTPLRFIFAGEFGPRKGAEVLIKALQKINDLQWEIEIIGTVDPVISRKFSSFLTDYRVTLSGFLPRLELAKHMSSSNIFIFPSLAEGSARVIFMAMACGCYVITTPNSGSIVADGIHGSQVMAGDVEALEKAIRETLTMEREKIMQIGANNAERVRNNYTQKHYGESLFRLYEKLIANPNIS